MITAYGLEWHTQISGAFHDLLIEPLSSYVDISLHAWDGHTPIETVSGQTLIFCMLPPPISVFANAGSHIVWIPMGDHFDHFDDQFWASLPRTLHIVAFSEKVATKTSAEGFPTLKLKYFKNPADFPVAKWNHGKRILLYWNRRGLVGPHFLKKLCRALEVDTLLFKGIVDGQLTTDVPISGDYQLPAHFGRTRVEQIAHFDNRQKYLDSLARANIFVAPRQEEGVGMLNIEALASGCAVFAYDAPTMNEYITSGEDGYLLQHTVPVWTYRLVRFTHRIRCSIHYRLGLTEPAFLHPIRSLQNWRQIRHLDLSTMGKLARQHHQNGYQAWLSSIPEYVEFITQ